MATRKPKVTTAAQPDEPPKANGGGKIELPRLDIQMFRLTLVGDSSYISHAWAQKSKIQMLDKQMKKAKQAKEARDPAADFEASIYRDAQKRPCIPAAAIKLACVDACSHVSGITKVLARGALFVVGDLLPIKGGPPRSREDMTRNATGVADLRYRAEFDPWSVDVVIRHNVNVISAEQVINLIDTAGFAIGIGDWRPQRDGNHGMFHVLKDGEGK